MRAAGIIDELAQALRRAPAHRTLAGVVAPARPYVTARLFARLDAPLLIVTAGNADADRLREEVAFLLPRGVPVLSFPSWEVLPFEPLSPEPQIAAARIAALAVLLGGRRAVVVAPLDAALQFLLPKGRLAAARLDIARGHRLDEERLARHLLQWGYRPAARVSEAGEFSRRGGILDVFPPGLEAPVRVDLFGDEVDALHFFDPETQRSAGSLERVRLPPAREVCLDTGVVGALKPHLPPPEDPGAPGLAQRAAALPGLEHYQAALLHSRQTLLDYFPSPPVVLVNEYPDVEGRAERLAAELEEGASRAALPALADPARAYLGFEAWRARLKEHSVLYLDLFGLSPPSGGETRLETATGRSFLLSGAAAAPREGPLTGAVRALAARQSDTCLLVVARTEEDAARLGGLFREHGLGTAAVAPQEVPALADAPAPGAPRLTWGPAVEGFTWPEAGIALVTEEDLFGTGARPRAAEPAGRRALVPDFALLRPGDYLVHLDYGVGRYGGLERLPAEGGETADFVVMLYQDGDRLYVPVGSLDRVQRYLAAEGARPHLDRLGGRGWATARRRAKKAILTMARELLRLAALRQTAPGHAFPPDTPWQAEFELAFEYALTRDQQRAVEEVKADMERPHPMDRLICGDVGYGKTEVALRAAFKAVMDGRQVALLAPTTVLAQQHFTTFRERFAPWPARVEMLSRFVPAREQARIVAGVAAGEVDIVIGTHRLLGRDVSFHDLGLIVIDEEQRFGVRHKEALKHLRATVDVLTLTATPIPRTLHLALSGLRDLSLVSTPPENRLAIRTTIARFSPPLVQEAVRREVSRGGQVFFIHNRVRSIHRIGAWLARLLPEARIGIAHGQMEERALAEVMARFREGGFDVLLSTSIVESGLDIPNANTMLVNRADAFGLAELYQLRGRIGRSRHRAYAYLLIPGEESLSPPARRRIEVLREYSHLGAGFQVALYDLEIRGAGNIVGYQQSGHLAALGFELYTQMLRDTIAELQGEPVREARPAQVSLPRATYLPEDYVPETAQRLIFYKRLASARGPEDLEDAARELRERFGPLPGPAQRLLRAAELRLAGERLDLERLEWREEALELRFRRGTPVPPERVASVIARSGGAALLAGEHRLRWRWTAAGEEERLEEARGLLRALEGA